MRTRIGDYVRGCLNGTETHRPGFTREYFMVVEIDQNGILGRGPDLETNMFTDLRMTSWVRLNAVTENQVEWE